MNHQLIFEATDMELQLGDEVSPDDFVAYQQAMKYRDLFLVRKLSFRDYIDALSSLPIDIDAYLENMAITLNLV
ncbi:hypothetical protein V0288_04610 [Pannus brasiliensis CCIBt3594]|uniref:Uncharacterized protein n=1 Tax=Pannus brasiliensis CCIBt3594 TaxID=1427578 RepID=A0AAW9QH32_9CHRO